MLVERHPEEFAICYVGKVGVQEGCYQDGTANLEDEFFPGFEPVSASVSDVRGELQPIVDAAEGTEPYYQDNCLLDEGVVESCPEQGGGKDGEDDDEASHGGCICFFFG